MIWDFSNSTFGNSQAAANLFLFNVAGHGAPPQVTVLGDGTTVIGGVNPLRIQLSPTQIGGIN